MNVLFFGKSADTYLHAARIIMRVLQNSTGRISCQCQAGLTKNPKYIQRNHQGEYQQNSGHPGFLDPEPFRFS